VSDEVAQTLSNMMAVVCLIMAILYFMNAGVTLYDWWLNVRLHRLHVALYEESTLCRICHPEGSA
jgi:hypothetical protein